MAVTNYALAGVSDETKKRMQQAQQAYTPSAQTTQLQQNAANLQAAKPGAYTASADVNAAKQNLQAAQAAKPGSYQQSAAVTAAQNTLAQLQANKPQGYNSKYAPQLESIMQQIQNPEKFKYEFNGDNVFKAYADEYTQRGKQAALDVQGQAAALTGGYGNSYGQSVGQQTYQQYQTQLYDKGLELQNAAYQRWLDEQNAIKDRYSILKNADESEYDRYRDTVGDWRQDVDYATGRYDTERDVDYNRFRDTVNDYNDNLRYLTDVYNNERNVDYNRYRDIYGDWQTAEEQAYNRAQAQEQLDYERYQIDLNYWTGLAQIENGAYNTEQDRQEAIRQFNLEYQLKLDQWEFEKAQMLAAMEGGGGSGGGGKQKTTNEEPATQQTTGKSFQQATNEVQTNILKNNQNLPASTLNKNLTGTVGDYLKQAQEKLASMPATLQKAITGSTQNTQKSTGLTTKAYQQDLFKSKKKN